MRPGQLKTGRDVAVAALLEQEFIRGFNRT
jgi:hypothetical protein